MYTSLLQGGGRGVLQVQADTKPTDHLCTKQPVLEGECLQIYNQTLFIGAQ